MKLSLIAIAAFGAFALSACETPSAPANSGPVQITFERTPCFGACPDYTVSIDGDGNVIYNGRRFVGVTGEQHGKASPEDVQALLHAFDAVHFESLNDTYHANVTDLPAQIITLTRNGHTKRVVDYEGVAVGMPQAVVALEQQIDRVANTDQWVRRPSGTSQKSGKPAH